MNLKPQGARVTSAPLRPANGMNWAQFKDPVSDMCLAGILLERLQVHTADTHFDSD